MTANQNHPPPLHLQLHLALADIVDDVLEVLPSKGPPEGLSHQLFQKVKLGNLLDPLGDLSSTFTLLRMDAKFSSMLAGQQKCSHSPASTRTDLLLPCPPGPHLLLLQLCRPPQSRSFGEGKDGILILRTISTTCPSMKG